MHFEKNLAINILKTIIGEKYMKKMWHNLEVLSTCDTLWLKPHPTMTSETIVPIAP
jgi:hypothetical protein